jgi:hypothetical protein
MKSEKLDLLLVILVVLLILFTYARFNQIEQKMTRDKIQDLNLRMDELITTIKRSDMQFRLYGDGLRRLEEKASFADSERQVLSAKIESLFNQVQSLQTLASTSKDSGKKSVELGSISVKKKK